MTVYNSENFLADVFNSVIHQTYKDFELIIIDDGSTDNSTAICQRLALADSRIKNIRQENSGSQVARNNGLDIASGKYIAFVDSDDTVDPHIYEILISNLEENDADVSVCSFSMNKDALGVNPNRKQFTITGSNSILEALVGHGTNLPKLQGYLFNKVYKKEILDRHRMNPLINMGEDGLFNMYVMQDCNKAVYENSTLYYYRWSDNSLTNTHSRAYAKWKKDVDGYDMVLQTDDNPFITDYSRRMFIFCAMKKAEAIIREKGNFKEVYTDIKKVKSFGKMNLYNKKATIMYNLYTYAPFLFFIYKKIALRKYKI
jgi:glycosyltransferase involved in cell wall biosynthesis